jgi:hypothetical protein
VCVGICVCVCLFVCVSMHDGCVVCMYVGIEVTGFVTGCMGIVCLHLIFALAYICIMYHDTYYFC